MTLTTLPITLMRKIQNLRKKLLRKLRRKLLKLITLENQCKHKYCLDANFGFTFLYFVLCEQMISFNALLKPFSTILLFHKHSAHYSLTQLLSKKRRFLCCLSCQQQKCYFCRIKTNGNFPWTKGGLKRSEFCICTGIRK